MKSVQTLDAVKVEISSSEREASSSSLSELSRSEQAPDPKIARSWRNQIARIFAGKPVIALSESESIFPMSPEQAWSTIAFYEELLCPLPLLLRLAVPEPLGVEGKKSGVGSVVYCVYRLGYLRKRVTQMDAPSVLRFEVLEQNLGIEKGLRAIKGYYLLEPVGDGCRIRVGTHYESRMHPRWLWSPVEQCMMHALHGHILENMKQSGLRALKAQGAAQ